MRACCPNPSANISERGDNCGVIASSLCRNCAKLSSATDAVFVTPADARSLLDMAADKLRIPTRSRSDLGNTPVKVKLTLQEVGQRLLVEVLMVKIVQPDFFAEIIKRSWIPREQQLPAGDSVLEAQTSSI